MELVELGRSATRTHGVLEDALLLRDQCSRMHPCHDPLLGGEAETGAASRAAEAKLGGDLLEGEFPGQKAAVATHPTDPGEVLGTSDNGRLSHGRRRAVVRVRFRRVPLVITRLPPARATAHISHGLILGDSEGRRLARPPAWTSVRPLRD